MQASNEVLHAYLQVSHKITEEMRGHFGKSTLTYPQTLVLALLDCDGPMPISSLARAAGSANSTVSGIVDRLENAGLVRRVRSEQDRRVIFVEVTERYHEGRDQAGSFAMQRFDRAVNSMDEEQLRAVLNGLSILSRALEEQKEKDKENNNDN